MELRQNLSDNLKVLRQAREATLEGFSLDIGISRSTLQEIEAGKATPRWTLWTPLPPTSAYRRWICCRQGRRLRSKFAPS